MTPKSNPNGLDKYFARIEAMKRALGQALEEDIRKWVKEKYMTKKKAAPAKRPNRADLTLRNLKPLHERIGLLEDVIGVLLNQLDPNVQSDVRMQIADLHAKRLSK